MSNPALFVAFEGLPGAGKTFLMNRVQSALRAEEINIQQIDIEEIPEGADLRAIADRQETGDVVRSILFWAMRILQSRAIKTERLSCDVVFADRFIGTTVVVDGFGSDIPSEILAWVSNELATVPDITFFVDVPLGIARSRKLSRSFTDMTIEKQREIEKAYSMYADTMGWITLDGREQEADKSVGLCLAQILYQLDARGDEHDSGAGM